MIELQQIESSKLMNQPDDRLQYNTHHQYLTCGEGKHESHFALSSGDSDVLGMHRVELKTDHFVSV